MHTLFTFREDFAWLDKLVTSDEELNDGTAAKKSDIG